MPYAPLPRRFAAALALALLAALPGAAQQAPPRSSLADLVPATAVAFAAIPDLKAAREALAGTDFGKIWKEMGPFVDEVVRGLEAPITDLKAQFEHNAGIPLDDALAAIGGGMEIAVLDTTSDAVVSIRTGANEAQVKALVARMRESAARSGKTMHVADVPGAVVFSDSEANIKGIQAALAAPPPQPLSRSPEFQAVRAATVKEGAVPVAQLYVTVAPLLEEAVKNDENAAKRLYQTGVRDVRALGGAIAISGGKLAFVGHAHAPAQGERQGVLPILYQGPADVAGLAKLAPADAAGFLAMKLDLALSLDRLEKLVSALDPQGGQQLRDALAELDKRLRMSLKNDVLGALGSDWTGASILPEGGGAPVGVLSVSVKDGDRAMNMMRQVASALGMETRETTRAGRSVRYVLAPLGRFGEDPSRRMQQDPLAAAPIFFGLLGSAYTLDGGRLYIADMPQTLEEWFARSRAGGDLTSSPAFQAALKEASPAAGFFGYMDPRHMIPAFWNPTLRFARMFEGPARMFGLPVDLALLPRGATVAKLCAPGFTEVAADANGLTIRTQATMAGVEPNVAMVAIVAAIAIPNLIESRKGSNEAAAIGALRTMTTAQALFREGDKDRDTRLDYATSLAELQKANLVDGVLGAGLKQGYRFRIIQGDDFSWSAEAVPAAPGKTGDRSFFVDESGVIRFEVAPLKAGRQSKAIGGMR